MITRLDLQDRAVEWQLAEKVVEKDWVIGWLLWGIGRDEVLGSSWAFKGGTCLKKCFIETYRFSEDLDFTVLPDGPIDADAVAPLLERVLREIEEESGIQLLARPPLLKPRGPGSLQGKIYYRGLGGQQMEFSIKLDLLAEVVVRETVRREITHPYPDAWPDPATVLCYSLEGVFAEKIRAMGERGRPRDLFDIVTLHRREEFELRGPEIASILKDKCETKGVALPSPETVITEIARELLETEWENMLAHQLPALPPFTDYWSELENLFDWLNGTPLPREALTEMRVPSASSAVPFHVPPTIRSWGSGSVIERIRFAGVNRLLINLGYQGSRRPIEPYSLRESRDGNVLLFARRHTDGQIRAYRLDRIENIEVMNQSFTPVFRVEFSSSGRVSTPPIVGGSGFGSRPARSRRSSRAKYVVECQQCGREFERVKPDSSIRPHKDYKVTTVADAEDTSGRFKEKEGTSGVRS